MSKFSKTIAATTLLAALLGGTTVPAEGRATGRADAVVSVPEAWSPEGRAPYTPPSLPEAWSGEGRTPAGS